MDLKGKIFFLSLSTASMLGTAVVHWHLKHLHRRHLADTLMHSNIQKVLWFQMRDNCDQQMASMQLRASSATVGKKCFLNKCK